MYIIELLGGFLGTETVCFWERFIVFLRFVKVEEGEEEERRLSTEVFGPRRIWSFVGGFLFLFFF